MKKLLCLCLLLTVLISALTACAPNEGTTGTTQSTQASTAPEIDTITIAQALELCGEEGNITQERYTIRATVESVTNATYGAMVLKDETGTISVYGTYSEDGSVGYAQLTDKPYKGDDVLVSCILQNYNGTKEIKSAWLLSFTHNQVEVDASAYTEMTIQSARDAETGAKVKVDGIVAQITYADGMIPSGIFLVDETGSILVHDGDLAQRVKIGNQITILADKTFWILGSEAANAEKFGYKGSCQLENAVMLENDERTDKGFDHSWVPSSSILTLMSIPVDQNVTTSIYKVNALVKKVEGKDFVTYYFYDLDGTTGSYAYSQCGGEDFAWLDEFDGKICTVYLSLINCKTTATDCFYRLQPIQVLDEGFTVDERMIAEYAAIYCGSTQFLRTYSGDPMLEVVTTASSQLLGFENAKISYTSSDPSIVKFEEIDGKLYMRGLKAGTAEITVTGSYGEHTFFELVPITITEAVNADYGTVQDAIASAAGTKVTIKGIVGPSVVNQPGFYLIDETGVIPIALSEDLMQTVEIGHEIIIEGIRDYRNPKDSDKCIGQTYVKDPVIVTNNYGTHEYATGTFLTDKTLADFYNLDAMEDHSTEVYIMKGKLEFVETNFFTSVKFTDGTTTVNIYCANAGQYSFLEAFRGQEITIELAACNWNSKGYYTGCVLAVYTENGKVLNQLNFG